MKLLEIQPSPRGESSDSISLTKSLIDHRVLARLKRIALLTHDAEFFYRDLGFSTAKHGSIYLERLRETARET